MDPLNQPQNPPVVSAPISPPSPPGVTSEGLSQEQMRSNLQDLMSKIDGKYQDFNTQKFSSNNGLQENKNMVLRQVFDLLQASGVDPSDPEAVQAFLDKIKGQNPELYQQIVQVLQSLMGDESAPLDQSKEGVTPQPTGGIIPGNMNINPNEDIQKNL